MFASLKCKQWIWLYDQSKNNIIDLEQAELFDIFGYTGWHFVSKQFPLHFYSLFEYKYKFLMHSV